MNNICRIQTDINAYPSQFFYWFTLINIGMVRPSIISNQIVRTAHNKGGLDSLTAKIETENDGKTAGNAFEINYDRVRTPTERPLHSQRPGYSSGTATCIR
ncbi:TPA: hypothetical protein ACXHW4_004752 [Enterobacter hormaechei]